MNILIVGSGSIATKHKNNIEFHGHHAFFLKDLLKNKNKKQSYILNFYESILGSYDAVIIANASNQHFQYAKIALNHAKKIYLEKPPCLSLAELNELIDLSKKYKNPVPIGFQLRFSKGINRLKQLAKKDRNNIVAFDIHVGQNLNQWRKGGVNQNSYYANRKTGGGVLYELCHEIDIAMWIFGIPKSFLYQLSNLSNQDMDIDDFFHSVWQFKNMNGIVHMDMINPLYQRYIDITFSDYRLSWNIKSDSVSKINNEESVILYENKSFERQELLSSAISNFLSWVQKNDAWKGALLEESIPLLNFIKKVENEK